MGTVFLVFVILTRCGYQQPRVNLIFNCRVLLLKCTASVPFPPLTVSLVFLFAKRKFSNFLVCCTLTRHCDKFKNNCSRFFLPMFLNFVEFWLLCFFSPQSSTNDVFTFTMEGKYIIYAILMIMHANFSPII